MNLEDPHNPELLAELMLDYLHGEISDEAFELLCEQIQGGSIDLDRCVEMIRVATMTRELCRLDGAARRELVAQADPEHNVQDLIAALMPPEDLEPVDFVEVIERGRGAGQHEQPAAKNIKFGQLALYSLKLIPKRWVYGSVAALLALTAVTIVLVNLVGEPDLPEHVAQDPGRVLEVTTHVAELFDVKNARWDSAPGETAPLEGDRLEPGRRLTLTSGFAAIRTTRGAVAIMQAPCTVQLTDSDNALRLVNGQLVGVVETDRAKGFTVLTPSAEIVDLSTRFGVVYDGTTRTQVLEGKVQVKAVNSSVGSLPTVLGKGKGAVVDAEALEVVTQIEVLDHFVADWQQVASQPQLQGEVRFETTMPQSLHYGVFERDWIALFREKAGVTLPAELAVTVDGPGEHFELATLESSLPKGTRVDSYLLHLDLPGEVKANSRRSATITFDRPILAVISRSTQLAESDALLGLDSVHYIKGNQAEKKFGGVRGMEPASSRLEAIKISDDRRTLTVDMILMGASIDQARVVLEAKEAAN